MTRRLTRPCEKRIQPGAVEPGVHPRRHPGPQPARPPPPTTKWAADFVDDPSRKFEVSEKEFGLRTLIESFCATDNGWFGAPSWGHIVDRFLTAVDDRENAHWRIHRDKPWFDEWFTNRPAEIADITEFRRLLLAGPDLLSEEAAEWCVDGAIGYVCQDDHANGCPRCGIPLATESSNE